MDKEERNKINKLYLMMKKELLLKLKGKVKCYKFGKNIYFVKNNYKNISVQKYLTSDYEEENIKYLKELVENNNLSFQIKYSPYRPIVISPTYEFIRKYYRFIK